MNVENMIPVVILIVCVTQIKARLYADGCQENTYLCDAGNNELCNANAGQCECEENFFAVDAVCAPNGRPGDLCREGTIGSNGRCNCYYGYTRMTDNTCGLCLDDADCNEDQGVVTGLDMCINDGYQGKCFKECRWNSQCTLSGQKCLEHEGHYVCKCPEGLFKHPDGSCNNTPNRIGSAPLTNSPRLKLIAVMAATAVIVCQLAL
ncbi:uncharacterized protein LOC142344661 [Convolutriloba macropyga]|uniref:uncharacterized protein LOC142344661 n=1 Tax=Convolutriloba macropyga TaxID=536237 RepID=UPI003F528539